MNFSTCFLQGCLSPSFVLCSGVCIFSLILWLPGVYILSLLLWLLRTISSPFSSFCHMPCPLFTGWFITRFWLHLLLSTLVSYLLGFWPFGEDLLDCVLILQCQCFLCLYSLWFWGVFSLWLWVLCSMGYWLLTDYFVYFEGFEFQLCFSIFDLGLQWLLLHFWLFALVFDHSSKIIHYLLAEWFYLLFVEMFESRIGLI